ncbi:MAG: ATP-binding protein [Anaerolineaceae bacterium]
MRKSLRWQFTIPLVFFFAVAFLLISFYFFQTFLSIYQDHLKKDLTVDASVFIEDLQNSPEFPLTISDLQTKTDHYATLFDLRITVINSNGIVLSDSEVDPSVMENHLSRPEVQQALKGENGYQIRYSTTLKTNLLYAAVPLSLSGQVLFIIRLALPVKGIESELSILYETIAIVGVISLILSLLITFLVFNNAIRPLSKLGKVAKEFSEGNFQKIPYRINGNEIDQLTIVFDEMGARINAQMNTLREEKAKITSILEQMADGVVIVDSKGKVQLLNPAAERMFGVKSQFATGKSLIEAFGLFQIVELYQNTLRSGKVETVTLDLISSHRSLQGIATVISEFESTTILLLFQDITQQRQIDKMRQDFVSNVSHELRTPLASLKALTETLQDGAVDDPPTAKHFIDRMDIEVEKLTQMVVELLELSRIEYGQISLHLADCDVNDLLSETIDRLKLQAERTAITLVYELPENFPPVYIDRGQIEHVLVNLIHNALKFTPPGGKVTVSAKSEPDQTVFRVEDTGIGIDEETLPRIFERFYKSDESRTSHGTGLGLSIAKHIIEMHHGKIWVDSVLGKGTIFNFSLPNSPAK